MILLKVRIRINNDLQDHCGLTGSANGKNLKTMNREDEEQLLRAGGAFPRPVFGSDVAARQVMHLSSELSETRVLKEKDPERAEISDEGWWRSYYKDANAAKYVIGDC